MAKKIGALPIGYGVKVRRCTGEIVQGWIASPPLEHLLPIGEFYIVSGHPMPPDGVIPYYRGTGRKSQARREYESTYCELGMYERGAFQP